MTADDEARARMALVGLRRYNRLKAAVSAIAFIAVGGLAVGIIAPAHGFWWAVGAFLIGEVFAVYIIGPLVMLPLGYAFCGREAMALGRASQLRR